MSRTAFQYQDALTDLLWRVDVAFDRCFLAEMPSAPAYLSFSPTERQELCDQLAAEAVYHARLPLKERIDKLEDENRRLRRLLGQRDDEWCMVDTTN